jgi:hypothetical protein
MLKQQCDLVQTTTGHTQASNELLDTDDVFLVRVGSKDNSRAPCATAFANPAVSFEHLQVLHDDLAFVRTTVQLLAANRRRVASVNGKFKLVDRFLDTRFVEAVSTAFDNGGDRSIHHRISIGTNKKQSRVSDCRPLNEKGSGWWHDALLCCSNSNTLLTVSLL